MTLFDLNQPGLRWDRSVEESTLKYSSLPRNIEIFLINIPERLGISTSRETFSLISLPSSADDI